jgi:mono/diheme cytochrome c family protein
MYQLAANDPPGSAEQVYAAECAACHADFTSADMLEMMPSASEMAEDPEMIHDLVAGMIVGSLVNLQEMGTDYLNAPEGAMIDTTGFYAPYMPPFVGTDAELEALAVYLSTLSQAEPSPQRLANPGGVE